MREGRGEGGSSSTKARVSHVSTVVKLAGRMEKRPMVREARCLRARFVSFRGGERPSFGRSQQL